MIFDHRRSDQALLAALLAVLLAAAAVLPCIAAGAATPSAREDDKKITLDWIYKKKHLGIDDPTAFLPQSIAWSPKGHLLAFLQKTHAHGRIVVVVDPDRPKRATS